MKAIGFANKYYTLWDIVKETRPLGNGHNYVITHFNYIKNISMEKDVAFAKFPGLPFDENLRGHYSSWQTEKEVWDNVDIYRFGKYKYEKIDNSNLNYLSWYWDNISDEAHKAFVENILTENGYEVREFSTGSKYLMSPEDLKAERNNMKEFNKKLEEVKNSDTLELVMTSNPDMYGYYRDGDVLYKFEEVKENYYNGFLYYLPVLKGKAKRVKNKTLVITKFDYEVNEHTLNINIKDFKIAK